MNEAKVIQLKSKDLKRVFVSKSDGKFGVENLKEVMTVVVTFFVDVFYIIKNKEWLNIVPLIVGLLKHGNILSVAAEAWNEIKDLSQAETAEINAHFAAIFDLEDDKAEAVIEKAFSYIPRAYAFVEKAIDLVIEGRSFVNEFLAFIKGSEGEIEEMSQLLKAA